MYVFCFVLFQLSSVEFMAIKQYSLLSMKEIMDIQ